MQVKKLEYIIYHFTLKKQNKTVFWSPELPEKPELSRSCGQNYHLMHTSTCEAAFSMSVQTQNTGAVQWKPRMFKQSFSQERENET